MLPNLMPALLPSLAVCVWLLTLLYTPSSPKLTSMPLSPLCEAAQMRSRRSCRAVEHACKQHLTSCSCGSQVTVLQVLKQTVL